MTTNAPARAQESEIGELLTRLGSDKDTAHSYGDVYQRLFEPIQSRVQMVLEVGIQSGASLYAWARFFPHALVFGLDISSDLIFAPRITSFRCDSRNADEVAACLRDYKFDIVIDDGGHWLEDQEPTWENLYPRVKPGGLYIVEDLQSVEAMQFFQEHGAEVLDLRPVKSRGDDILAIFRKGDE